MGRSKRDTGNWLVTYSDLVTLLLVFFVLLYMLTPGIDDSTFDNFISHFQSSVGVINQSSVVTRQSNDRTQYRIEVVQRYDTLEDFLKERGLESQVEIENMPEGLKITLSDSLTFNSGSSELLPMAREVLRELAVIFDEEVESTEVQGHTDNVPIAQNSYYRSNWHLGAARSVSVVQFIRDHSTLDPDRYKASSYGEYRPVTTNETPGGRRQNRRVEIYVRYKGLLLEESGKDFASDQQRIAEPSENSRQSN
ncbi:MAG: flagellar motor protein MotB [Balneolaceae bacterium]|nr:flagellar motor protein MotB [Balneolaceae bacterium]MCH8547909.1 flagellar motor protein MotB [Balneolaceae bacterium]